MASDISSDAPWDDDEDLDVGEDSVLDTFHAYAPTDEADDVDHLWDVLEPPANEEEQGTTLLFTASNPSGSVSVTVLGGGQVLRAELTPQVTRMTESELAEEVTVISSLARHQAQAGQHVLVALLMRRLGHDKGSTRSFLESELGLPSPHTVDAERSRIFAARYGDHG